jgi:Protein of unknown function (DUF4244)
MSTSTPAPGAAAAAGAIDPLAVAGTPAAPPEARMPGDVPPDVRAPVAAVRVVATPFAQRAVRRRPAGVRPWRRRRRAVSVPADPEAGMATAEYAIATVAAAGFAGLLVVILRSGEVRELLLGIVRSALSL